MLLTACDLNGDNSVDATDFALFIGSYHGNSNIPGSGYKSNADLNFDGLVDATDCGLFVGDFGATGAP